MTPERPEAYLSPVATPVSVRFPDGKSAEVPRGTPLPECARRAGTTFRFGCENGICGVCLAPVIAPNLDLDPADERETETLTQNHAAANERLVCQLRATGDLEIRNREKEC